MRAFSAVAAWAYPARPSVVSDCTKRIAWASANRDALRGIGAAGQRRAADFDMANYAARYEAIYLATIGG